MGTVNLEDAAMDSVPDDALILARGRIAEAIHARAEGWETVARLLAAPDLALVGDLRNGQVAGALHRSVAGHSDEASALERSMPALTTYAAVARRNPAERDLRDLREDHEDVLLGDFGADRLEELRSGLAAMAQLCRREAAAWEAGDMADAKELLVTQHVRLLDEVTPLLVEGAGALARDGLAPLSRTLGKLALGFCSAQTGADHVRAAMAHSRRKG